MILVMSHVLMVFVQLDNYLDNSFLQFVKNIKKEEVKKWKVYIKLLK